MPIESTDGERDLKSPRKYPLKVLQLQSFVLSPMKLSQSNTAWMKNLYVVRRVSVQ